MALILNRQVRSREATSLGAPGATSASAMKWKAEILIVVVLLVGIALGIGLKHFLRPRQTSAVDAPPALSVTNETAMNGN